MSTLSKLEQTPSLPEGRCAEDRGFTLIELLTAMSVFGVLMIVVAAAMLSGFTSIHDVMARTAVQGDTQNAAEWTSRLLRYMAVPTGQTSAVVEASPTSITFFTYSGTGSKNDVPYKARISMVTNADATKSLVTDIWTPVLVSAVWTWPEPATHRVLMTVKATDNTPLALKVSACNALTDCYTTIKDVTPALLGPLVLATGEVPQSVTISIGDPAITGNVVTQQVRLVNLG